MQAGDAASDLLRKLGTAPLAVVWEESDPVGTITLSQLGAAANRARLLADLAGAERRAA